MTAACYAWPVAATVIGLELALAWIVVTVLRVGAELGRDETLEITAGGPNGH